jgi:hypothetical protein
MKPREIYIQQTGNTPPSNQIAYHEWMINYSAWMDLQIEHVHLEDGTHILDALAKIAFGPGSTMERMVEIKELLRKKNPGL